MTSVHKFRTLSSIVLIIRFAFMALCSLEIQATFLFFILFCQASAADLQQLLALRIRQLHRGLCRTTSAWGICSELHSCWEYKSRDPSVLPTQWQFYMRSFNFSRVKNNTARRRSRILFPEYIFYTQTRLHSYKQTYYTYIQSYIHTNTCRFNSFFLFIIKKKKFDILYYFVYGVILFGLGHC